MMRIGEGKILMSFYKLRTCKNLSDPYDSRIDKDPKKGVEDDLDGEIALESKKELN